MQNNTLHYSTIQYSTVHYSTLYFITFHYIHTSHWPPIRSKIGHPSPTSQTPHHHRPQGGVNNKKQDWTPILGGRGAGRRWTIYIYIHTHIYLHMYIHIDILMTINMIYIWHFPKMVDSQSSPWLFHPRHKSGRCCRKRWASFPRRRPFWPCSRAGWPWRTPPAAPFDQGKMWDLPWDFPEMEISMGKSWDAYGKMGGFSGFFGFQWLGKLG